MKCCKASENRSSIPYTKSTDGCTDDEEPKTGSNICCIKSNNCNDDDGACLTSIRPKGSNDKTAYVRTLEKNYEELQTAFFDLTSHFARVQFRLKQIGMASAGEQRRMLRELEQVAFCPCEKNFKEEEMPQMQKDTRNMGRIRNRQYFLIDRLRSQLADLTDPDANLLSDK